MKKKIILKLSLLALLFLPLSCGFKVLNKSNAYNYSIKEIITSGNKRISYKIKNNLLANSKENSPNELIIYVKAEKSQDIKEKNIKNEITKYQVNLNVEISYNILSNLNKTQKINFSISGDYNVEDFHSDTINNEKNLLNNLIENIAEKIANQIGTKMNDL